MSDAEFNMNKARRMAEIDHILDKIKTSGYDSLSADEKKIFEEAALEARDVQRKAARAMTDKSRKVMTDHGMKLNEIAPEEIARMRAAVKPVTDKYAAQLDPELVKAFYAELEKTKNLK